MDRNSILKKIKSKESFISRMRSKRKYFKGSSSKVLKQWIKDQEYSIYKIEKNL